jgi:hypothetical protein
MGDLVGAFRQPPPTMGQVLEDMFDFRVADVRSEFDALNRFDPAETWISFSDEN